MFCSQCGAEMVNGACPNCTAENTQTAEQAYEPGYVEVKTEKKKKNLVLAIICLATGIASIIWGLGIPGGIAALITGSLFKKKYGESHPMVKAGTVCGVIGILIQALIVVGMMLYYVLYIGLLVAIFANY